MFALLCVLPSLQHLACAGTSPSAGQAMRAAAGRSVLVRMSEPATSFYKPPPLDEATLHAGQLVPCTILSKDEDSGGYVVDIGIQRPALLPRNEVRLNANQTKGRRGSGRGWARLELGSVFEAQVLPPINQEQLITDTPMVNVSVARAQRRIAWQRVVQLADEDVAVEAPIMRFSGEGVTLDIEGLPAFLPWSHWQLPAEKRTLELHGTTLPVKFLDVDISRARLVVSHRRYRLQQAMSTLVPGALIEGTVSKVADFGVTVKLSDGIVEGLLHISQISERFVKDISTIFTPGQRIFCVVIKADTADGSVSLSTKRLEGRPGEMVADSKAVFERVRLNQQDGGDAAELADPAKMAAE